MYCPYFNYLQEYQLLSEDMYRQYSPPGGPPPFGGGAPGGQGTPGGPSGGPPGPPPSFTPVKSGPQVKAIETGAIRACRFRYVYIWLNNRRSFWAWLIFVGRTSIAGWRWDGRRWLYFGMDTRRIESFVCH